MSYWKDLADIFFEYFWKYMNIYRIFLNILKYFLKKRTWALSDGLLDVMDMFDGRMYKQPWMEVVGWLPWQKYLTSRTRIKHCKFYRCEDKIQSSIDTTIILWKSAKIESKKKRMKGRVVEEEKYFWGNINFLDCVKIK